MKQKKSRKVGRPELPKGEAKAGVIRVRVKPEHQKLMEAAAKTSKVSLSEWIRSTLNAAIIK